MTENKILLLDILNSVMQKSLYWDETLRNPELAKRIFSEIGKEIINFNANEE